MCIACPLNPLKTRGLSHMGGKTRVGITKSKSSYFQDYVMGPTFKSSNFQDYVMRHGI
jgi:hypothetical protein